MDKNDYLKIFSRFLKEEDSYYIVRKLNIKEYMDKIDNSKNKPLFFFNVFNKTCCWSDTDEGYEFYYSLTLKLILFCDNHYKTSFQENDLKNIAINFTRFSSNYGNRKYFKDIMSLITRKV